MAPAVPKNGQDGRIQVDWQSTAHTMGSDRARYTKNAKASYISGDERWLTWPDRFDGKRVNGMFVFECRFCGEYWGDGECECDVGWP